MINDNIASCCWMGRGQNTLEKVSECERERWMEWNGLREREREKERDRKRR